MTADDLLPVFDDAAKAARTALEPLTGAARRARTERPGQYALDLVADAAVLPILHEAGVAVVSEESGRSGRDDAAITVVLDPVDGSTNCSRDIPYWSISLCAVDADGPFCALVANQATGVRTTAVRGKGAWRDGEEVTPSALPFRRDRRARPAVAAARRRARGRCGRLDRRRAFRLGGERAREGAGGLGQRRRHQQRVGGARGARA